MSDDGIKQSGVIAGPGVTQEESDRIERIVHPMVAVLFKLDAQERFNVIASLLTTFGLSFTDPHRAVTVVAQSVLNNLDEAIDLIEKKPN